MDKTIEEKISHYKTEHENARRALIDMANKQRVLQEQILRLEGAIKALEEIEDDGDKCK